MQPDNFDHDGNEKHGHEKGHKSQIVAVLVNGHSVNLLMPTANGSEIKTAAIEQGVHIQLGFILEETLAEGGSRIVGDHEQMSLHENLHFTAHEKDHSLTISVNEQPVMLHGHTATGAAIKSAAIAQGVLIQPNFVLQEELPNGTSRIVGDNDSVHLHEHLRFTAITPDDNS